MDSFILIKKHPVFPPITSIMVEDISKVSSDVRKCEAITKSFLPDTLSEYVPGATKTVSPSLAKSIAP